MKEQVMIEYINKRMIYWAAWCKRRDDGGLGYPGSTSYCLVQIHGERGAGQLRMVLQRWR